MRCTPPTSGEIVREIAFVNQIDIFSTIHFSHQQKNLNNMSVLNTNFLRLGLVRD